MSKSESHECNPKHLCSNSEWENYIMTFIASCIMKNCSDIEEYFTKV